MSNVPINYLLKDALVLGKQTGTDLQLLNSIENKLFEFDIKGNSYQATRSGKNLLNVPKILTLTGIKIIRFILSPGTYKVSCKKVSHSGEKLPVLVFENNGPIIVNLESNLDTTITTQKDNQTVYIYSNGYNYSESEGIEATIEELMLSKEGGEYEEYGIMPSINYPSKIKSCGDNINLLDTTQINASSKAGVNVKDSNGLITLDGTTNADYGMFIIPITLDVGTYVASWVGKHQRPAFTLRTEEDVWIQDLIDKPINIETSGVYHVTINLGTKGFTFTPEETAFRLKLEKGTRQTAWNPYNNGCGNVNFKITDEANEEQTISFPMKEGQVLHAGDYLADDGIHRNNIKFILDGKNNQISAIDTSIKNKNRFRAKINQNVKQCDTSHSTAYCDKLKLLDSGATYNLEEGFTVNDNIYIFIYIESLSDKTEAEANLYFEENPLTFYMPLLQEIIEPYSAEQQEVYKHLQNLHTYKGTTHIYSEDEVSPIFEVMYVKKII